MENLLEQESQQLLIRKIDALRFYGGDTRERCSNGYMGRESQDAMFGDKNAYRTLNALLFEGIKNEQERIWTEDHLLNTEFIRRIDETVQIYTDIFTLMKEKNADFDSSAVGRRMEVTSQIVDCFANVYDVEKPAVTGYENVDRVGELLWAFSKSRQVLTNYQDEAYFISIEKKYKDEILKLLSNISDKIVDEHFTEISNICKAVFEEDEFLDVELNAFYNNLNSLCLN